jgi:long-chain acyl-CoA synthetase
MNLIVGIEQTALRQPHMPAIMFEGQVYSYRELLDSVDRVASDLCAELRLRRGDRVAVFLPNVPEFAMAYLATLKLGLIAVSLGSMLKTPEILHILQDCGASVLVTSRELCPEPAVLLEMLPELSILFVSRQGLQRADGTRLSHTGHQEVQTLALPIDAPAAILYTSGTTGAQKGAVLTHGNLIFNSNAAARYVKSGSDDRHLLFLPLFHCFGQNFILNTTLLNGGVVVLMKRFELDAALNAIESSGVTHFYGVPAVYMRLLDQPDIERQLASVRVFFSAAAPMPVDISRRFRQRFSRPIYEGYGLTETSPLSTYNHESSYRVGSIGTPIEHVALNVVSDDGSACEPGEWGEICIRGPNVMMGYFGREQESAQVLREGWFHSGDIGYRDADGYYFLVDRLKDMINRSGFKVWPREVEEVLYRHPAIKECAVVGAPHATLGEEVWAFVTLKDDSNAAPESLRAHCEAHLSTYKVPERFVLEPNIPKNPSGKVLKRELRRRSSEMAL